MGMTMPGKNRAQLIKIIRDQAGMIVEAQELIDQVAVKQGSETARLMAKRMEIWIKNNQRLVR